VIENINTGKLQLLALNIGRARTEAWPLVNRKSTKVTELVSTVERR